MCRSMFFLSLVFGGVPPRFCWVCFGLVFCFWACFLLGLRLDSAFGGEISFFKAEFACFSLGV